MRVRPANHVATRAVGGLVNLPVAVATGLAAGAEKKPGTRAGLLSLGDYDGVGAALDLADIRAWFITGSFRVTLRGTIGREVHGLTSWISVVAATIYAGVHSRECYPLLNHAVA